MVYIPMNIRLSSTCFHCVLDDYFHCVVELEILRKVSLKSESKSRPYLAPGSSLGCRPGLRLISAVAQLSLLNHWKYKSDRY